MRRDTGKEWLSPGTNGTSGTGAEDLAIILANYGAPGVTVPQRTESHMSAVGDEVCWQRGETVLGPAPVALVDPSGGWLVVDIDDVWRWVAPSQLVHVPK